MKVKKLGKQANKRTRIQESQFKLVEDAVSKWFLNARANSMPVSGIILQEKALSYYNQMKDDCNLPDKFEASSGWLTNFKHRYNICEKSIH